MLKWVIFSYVAVMVFGSLWMWYLHKKDELVGDYPLMMKCNYRGCDI